MTIHLRPHHLLCMLTFAGKGYSPQFVAHFESIVERLISGQESIEIVAGPDEICSTMEAMADGHCTNASVNQRDQKASESIARLLERRIEPGMQFTLNSDLLFALRTAFSDGTIRSACAGCQWTGLCDEIAQGRFIASRLTFSDLVPCASLPTTSS